MQQKSDHFYMAQAIKLAKKGWYSTMPNPRVGCVIVKANRIVAEGWHQIAGKAHAEVNALYQLEEIFISSKGTTVYVTLEPCAHTGKTAPCCDALIKADVNRVVFGMMDPNPAVQGEGLQRLKEAGIEVSGPVLENECRALNSGFIKRMETGLPFVRCKLAMSIDGRTAMDSGESQWITGPEAREDVQRLRARSCAIITGIGTVLADNPSMTVRSESYLAKKASNTQQPLRVIVGSRTQQKTITKDANILKAEGKTWQVDSSFSLKQILEELGKRQCNEVLLESGSTLAGAFMEQGLIDELVIYMAPKLLGNLAKPLFALPFEKMNEQITLNIVDIRAIGNDWRLTVNTIATATIKPVKKNNE